MVSVAGEDGVAQDEREARGGDEDVQRVEGFDEDADDDGVVEVAAALVEAEPDVEVEGDRKERHDERVHERPLAQRVQPQKRRLPRLRRQRQDAGAADHAASSLVFRRRRRRDPAGEHGHEFQIGPAAGAQRDQDRQRVHAGLPHVAHRVGQRELEEAAEGVGERPDALRLLEEVELHVDARRGRQVRPQEEPHVHHDHVRHDEPHQRGQVPRDNER
mmetsp:Transcript_1534/g.4574  ORF Transcript_1534/g.4574 Transcript_1534/m.4574 type:complete len:217 (+) Transcript_1534:1223-1873(+)